MDLYNGLKMTEEILLNTLKRHGLEKVSPMGEAFDPNKHEAVFQVPMSDKEPGTVFEVQQIGFALNGRTIRARLSLSMHSFLRLGTTVLTISCNRLQK